MAILKNDVYQVCSMFAVQCYFFHTTTFAFYKKKLLYNFLAISHILPGLYLERSDRDTMQFSNISPDAKNFCEFMTRNLPKPMFVHHFHPGLVGAFFISPKTEIWALGP